LFSGAIKRLQAANFVLHFVKKPRRCYGIAFIFFASFSTKFAALSLVHDPLNKSIGEILGFLKDHKYAKAIIHLPAANHHADGHV
jgi:hypothetical protein